MPRAATVTEAKARRIFSAMKDAGLEISAVEITADAVRVTVAGDGSRLTDQDRNEPKAWSDSPFDVVDQTTID